MNAKPSGIVPVILCGGGGTRLWPRSRAAKPKPFLPLIGNQTLFEATLARCDEPALFAPPVIVTSAQHLDHVQAQMSDDNGASVLVEPMARGTAAAVAIAALTLPEDAIMLVCPSDHHIADTAAFQAAAVPAAKLAADGWLVSMAITAQSPETGFGYLQRGEALGDDGFRTRRFVEKPDEERARAFLASGEYAWNGGIFAFRAGTFLTELETHRPEMAKIARDAMANGTADGPMFEPDPAIFAGIKGESVDYAVMENSTHAAMVPVECGWSDIGTWDSLHNATPQDAAGNSADDLAELVDCERVFTVSDGPRISAIGLKDIIIVVDGDDILVTTHAAAQKVGKLRGAANQ